MSEALIVLAQWGTGLGAFVAALVLLWLFATEQGQGVVCGLAVLIMIPAALISAPLMLTYGLWKLGKAIWGMP